MPKVAIYSITGERGRKKEDVPDEIIQAEQRPITSQDGLAVR